MHDGVRGESRGAPTRFAHEHRTAILEAVGRAVTLAVRAHETARPPDLFKVRGARFLVRKHPLEIQEIVGDFAHSPRACPFAAYTTGGVGAAPEYSSCLLKIRTMAISFAWHAMGDDGSAAGEVTATSAVSSTGTRQSLLPVRPRLQNKRGQTWT